MSATADSLFAEVPDLDDLMQRMQNRFRPEAHSPSPPPKATRAIRRKRIKYLKSLVSELKNESLRHFAPLPHLADFLLSTCPISIAVGSNQSGKTLHALFKFSNVVLGRDSTGQFPQRDGCAIIVGKDGDHLADPIYKKLFRPGEFKLIPDEQTGNLRAVRPDPYDPKHIDPYDLAYQEKWIDAPPLIPDRYVREHAWEHAGKEIPRLSRLATGWEILWRSSNGPPPRGRQIHLALVDEDLNRVAMWINELIPRILKHNGKLMWSATGQEGGPELAELVHKSESGSPYIDVFWLYIEDNPYITDAQREFLRETLTSEEEVNVRYYGKLASFGRYIYSDYDPQDIHGYEPFPIPDDWARYILLDPSIPHCATLFVAVDPQERHRWVYDGFDLRQAGPETWAQEVKARQSNTKFEAVVCDQQRGKVRHVGGVKDRCVAEIMWAALKTAGVEIRRPGPLCGFFPGCNDVEARTLALKTWLAPRGYGPFEGLPILQVAKGAIPLLDQQIRTAQSDPAGIVNRGNRVARDLLEALEYGAAFEPGYYQPEPLSITEADGKPRRNPSVVELFHEQQRHRQLKALAAGEGGCEYTSAMRIG